MSSPGHLPELDALRSQVTDLSHQLAGRDRSAQHQREQSDLLRAIVEGTAAETGEEFFSALVTHLTSVLHVKYALIGKCREITSRRSAPSRSRQEAPSSTISNMHSPTRPVPQH